MKVKVNTFSDELNLKCLAPVLGRSGTKNDLEIILKAAL